MCRAQGLQTTDLEVEQERISVILAWVLIECSEIKVSLDYEPSMDLGPTYGAKNSPTTNVLIIEG